MSNEAPTDALRLVPRRATPQQLEAAAFNLSAEIGAAEAMKLGPHIERAYELLVAAAPTSPLPGGGWQDISTAPKDGTLVDLFYPERGRLTDAAWGPTGWGRHEWRGSHTVRMVPSEKPTHWMPLPAAPTGDGA